MTIRSLVPPAPFFGDAVRLGVGMWVLAHLFMAFVRVIWFGPDDLLFLAPLAFLAAAVDAKVAGTRVFLENLGVHRFAVPLVAVVTFLLSEGVAVVVWRLVGMPGGSG